MTIASLEADLDQAKAAHAAAVAAYDEAEGLYLAAKERQKTAWATRTATRQALNELTETLAIERWFQGRSRIGGYTIVHVTRTTAVLGRPEVRGASIHVHETRIRRATGRENQHFEPYVDPAELEEVIRRWGLK